MATRTTLALFAAAALFAACNKGPPSPAYAEAVNEFDALYGQKLEDAYLTPEMEKIEAKFKSVPTSSGDYKRAEEMVKRIESGRERASAEKASRQQAIDAALTPSQMPPEPAQAAVPAADTQPARAEAPDAGVAEPVPGMPMAEFQRRFGKCFEKGIMAMVGKRGMRQTWKLKDLALCRREHPGLDQQVVVEEADKVLFLVPRSAMEVQTPGGATDGGAR